MSVYVCINYLHKNGVNIYNSVFMHAALQLVLDSIG